MFKNEKGSIPIAFIVALTSALTVLMLGNLLIAENLSNKKYNAKFENEVYQMKSALETTVNVVLQKMNEDETKYENQTFYAITSTDIQEVKNALNKNILPHIAPGTTIDITNLKYDKSLDMLCSEIIGQNPYTFQQEVTGIDCDATFFNMRFDLQLITPKGNKKINVKFDKLYPTVSNTTGIIKVNYDNVEIDFSGL